MCEIHVYVCVVCVQWHARTRVGCVRYVLSLRLLCPHSLERGSGWGYSTAEHQAGGLLSQSSGWAWGPGCGDVTAGILMNATGLSVLGRLDQTEGRTHLVTLMCSFEPPDACPWVFSTLTGPRILWLLWDGRGESGREGTRFSLGARQVLSSGSWSHRHKQRCPVGVAGGLSSPSPRMPRQ